jgi:hypothetical protein
MVADGKAVAVVLFLVMALLSFVGISTPSLAAQGEQRRHSFFNIRRGNPAAPRTTALAHPLSRPIGYGLPVTKKAAPKGGQFLWFAGMLLC